MGFVVGAALVSLVAFVYNTSPLLMQPYNIRKTLETERRALRTKRIILASVYAAGMFGLSVGAYSLL